MPHPLDILNAQEKLPEGKHPLDILMPKERTISPMEQLLDATHRSGKPEETQLLYATPYNPLMGAPADAQMPAPPPTLEEQQRKVGLPEYLAKRVGGQLVKRTFPVVKSGMQSAKDLMELGIPKQVLEGFGQAAGMPTTPAKLLAGLQPEDVTTGQEHITKGIDALREETRRRAYYDGYIKGVVTDIAESGLDIGVDLAIMKGLGAFGGYSGDAALFPGRGMVGGKAGEAGFARLGGLGHKMRNATKLDLFKLRAGSSAVHGMAGRIAGYGFLTTDGTLTERAKSAAQMTAFALTPYFSAGLLPRSVPSIGAAGIDAVLNMGLSQIFSGVYGEAIQQGGREGFMMAIPSLVGDIAFAAFTRAYPEVIRQQQWEQYAKTAAKATGQTPKQVLNNVKTAHGFMETTTNAYSAPIIEAIQETQRKQGLPVTPKEKFVKVLNGDGSVSIFQPGEVKATDVKFQIGVWLDSVDKRPELADEVKKNVQNVALNADEIYALIPDKQKQRLALGKTTTEEGKRDVLSEIYAEQKPELFKQQAEQNKVVSQQQAGARSLNMGGKSVPVFNGKKSVDLEEFFHKLPPEMQAQINRGIESGQTVISVDDVLATLKPEIERIIAQEEYNKRTRLRKKQDKIPDIQPGEEANIIWEGIQGGKEGLEKAENDILRNRNGVVEDKKMGEVLDKADEGLLEATLAAEITKNLAEMERQQKARGKREAPLSDRAYPGEIKRKLKKVIDRIIKENPQLLAIKEPEVKATIEETPKGKVKKLTKTKKTTPEQEAVIKEIVEETNEGLRPGDEDAVTEQDVVEVIKKTPKAEVGGKVETEPLKRTFNVQKVFEPLWTKSMPGEEKLVDGVPSKSIRIPGVDYKYNASLTNKEKPSLLDLTGILEKIKKTYPDAYIKGDQIGHDVYKADYERIGGSKGGGKKGISIKRKQALERQKPATMKGDGEIGEAAAAVRGAEKLADLVKVLGAGQSSEKVGALTEAVKHIKETHPGPGLYMVLPAGGGGLKQQYPVFTDFSPALTFAVNHPKGTGVIVRLKPSALEKIVRSGIVVDIKQLEWGGEWETPEGMRKLPTPAATLDLMKSFEYTDKGHIKKAKGFPKDAFSAIVYHKRDTLFGTGTAATERVREALLEGTTPVYRMSSYEATYRKIDLDGRVDNAAFIQEMKELSIARQGRGVRGETTREIQDIAEGNLTNTVKNILNAVALGPKRNYNYVRLLDPFPGITTKGAYSKGVTTPQYTIKDLLDETVFGISADDLIRARESYREGKAKVRVDKTGNVLTVDQLARNIAKDNAVSAHEKRFITNYDAARQLEIIKERRPTLLKPDVTLNTVVDASIFKIHGNIKTPLLKDVVKARLLKAVAGLQEPGVTKAGVEAIKTALLQEPKFVGMAKAMNDVMERLGPYADVPEVMKPLFNKLFDLAEELGAIQEGGLKENWDNFRVVINDTYLDAHDALSAVSVMEKYSTGVRTGKNVALLELKKGEPTGRGISFKDKSRGIQKVTYRLSTSELRSEINKLKESGPASDTARRRLEWLESKLVLSSISELRSEINKLKESGKDPARLEWLESREALWKEGAEETYYGAENAMEMVGFKNLNALRRAKEILTTQVERLERFIVLSGEVIEPLLKDEIVDTEILSIISQAAKGTSTMNLVNQMVKGAQDTKPWQPTSDTPYEATIQHITGTGVHGGEVREHIVDTAEVTKQGAQVYHIPRGGSYLNCAVFFPDFGRFFRDRHKRHLYEPGEVQDRYPDKLKQQKELADLAVKSKMASSGRFYDVLVRAVRFARTLPSMIKIQQEYMYKEWINMAKAEGMIKNESDLNKPEVKDRMEILCRAMEEFSVPDPSQPGMISQTTWGFRNNNRYINQLTEGEYRFARAVKAQLRTMAISKFTFGLVTKEMLDETRLGFVPRAYRDTATGEIHGRSGAVRADEPGRSEVTRYEPRESEYVKNAFKGKAALESNIFLLLDKHMADFAGHMELMRLRTGLERDELGRPLTCTNEQGKQRPVILEEDTTKKTVYACDTEIGKDDPFFATSDWKGEYSRLSDAKTFGIDVSNLSQLSMFNRFVGSSRREAWIHNSVAKDIIPDLREIYSIGQVKFNMMTPKIQTAKQIIKMSTFWNMLFPLSNNFNSMMFMLSPHPMATVPFVRRLTALLGMPVGLWRTLMGTGKEKHQKGFFGALLGGLAEASPEAGLGLVGSWAGMAAGPLLLGGTLGAAALGGAGILAGITSAKIARVITNMRKSTDAKLGDILPYLKKYQTPQHILTEMAATGFQTTTMRDFVNRMTDGFGKFQHSYNKDPGIGGYIANLYNNRGGLTRMLWHVVQNAGAQAWEINRAYFEKMGADADTAKRLSSYAVSTGMGFVETDLAFSRSSGNLLRLFLAARNSQVAVWQQLTGQAMQSYGYGPGSERFRNVEGPGMKSVTRTIGHHGFSQAEAKMLTSFFTRQITQQAVAGVLTAGVLSWLMTEHFPWEATTEDDVMFKIGDTTFSWDLSSWFDIHTGYIDLEGNEKILTPTVFKDARDIATLLSVWHDIKKYKRIPKYAANKMDFFLKAALETASMTDLSTGMPLVEKGAPGHEILLSAVENVVDKFSPVGSFSENQFNRRRSNLELAAQYAGLIRTSRKVGKTFEAQKAITQMKEWDQKHEYERDKVSNLLERALRRHDFSTYDQIKKATGFFSRPSDERAWLMKRLNRLEYEYKHTSKDVREELVLPHLIESSRRKQEDLL